ncbi:MAG: universal stress protein [Leptospirillum sp.]
MQIPFKTLVFPYDLTPLSPETAKTVKAVLQGEVTHLHVFHVMSLNEEIPMGYPIPPEYMDEIDRIAAQEVKKLSDILRKDGLKVSTGLYRGRPDRTIIEVALALKADAILLLSQGKGLMGRILLGSTSTSVLHHSPLPVILLKPDHVANRLFSEFSHQPSPKNLYESVLKPGKTGPVL